MRVTSFMLYKQFANSLSKNLSRLGTVQEQISSGKKLTKPSDDVIALRGAMAYRVSINSIQQYSRNIDEGVSMLALSESALSSTTSIINRARELALSESSDTATAETRDMTSYELQNLFNELIDIGNTKLKDRYIFSGYLSSTKSFSTTGAYQGDSNNIVTYTSEGITSKINVTGDSAFSDSTKYITDDLTSETLTGSLSITTGSNNAVIIPGSAYAFAAATPEAIRDTINAPMSDWYATEATTVGAGTLSVKIGNLDPVSVTVAAADTVSDVVTSLNAVPGLTAGLAYETTEAAGSRVKIFIRPTTAGDPVTIEITSDADLDDNDDNGLSALLHTDAKSNLTENALGIEAMVINDSSSKRLLFDPVVAGTTYTIAVDEDGNGTFSEAAEIDTTGLSQLYHASSAATNLNNSISFHMVLDHLRNSMVNNDSIGIRQSIKLLDGSMDGLLNVTADVGSRYKYLEDQKNRLEDNTLSYRQSLSSLEDADIAKVAMEITKIQTALEAMRISSLKSLQQSLFDFLG